MMMMKTQTQTHKTMVMMMEIPLHVTFYIVFLFYFVLYLVEEYVHLYRRRVARTHQNNSEKKTTQSYKNNPEDVSYSVLLQQQPYNERETEEKMVLRCISEISFRNLTFSVTVCSGMIFFGCIIVCCCCYIGSHSRLLLLPLLILSIHRPTTAAASKRLFSFVA